jgi:sortase A
MTSPNVAEEEEESVEAPADVISLLEPDRGRPPAARKAPPQAPRSRAARKPLPSVVAVAVWSLLSVGVLALWGLAYSQVLGSIQEHRSQHVLFAQFRGEVAAGTAPVGANVARGRPVATLEAPTVHIHHLVVVEGTTSADLEAGPGHRRDTPLPGEVGTSFLLGRSKMFGAPFARLTRLKPGDPISVTTGEGNFSFSVDGIRRPGDPLNAFDPSAARLTIVTSEGTKGGVRQVVYVDATLKGAPQAASSPRRSSLPAAERQMRGDRGAWLPIILWLEALLLVVVVLSWASVRWGLKPTLLVGVPIVVAAVWGVAEAAIRLLPNVA